MYLVGNPEPRVVWGFRYESQLTKLQSLNQAKIIPVVLPSSQLGSGVRALQLHIQIDKQTEFTNKYRFD